ncbi:MAG TPA: exosortase H [Thermoanaerobaculia bacterium]|nr:exosortase H [Thermoanaerobaculia bacterium]
MVSPRARFLLVFFLLLALFEIPLLLEPVDRNLVQPFTRGIATVSGALLNLFAGDVKVAGTMLISPCFSVNINNGCNGLEATLFLVAAVLAFPAPPKARAIAAATGIALIQGVNLIRVLSLYLIGCHRREWFDTFHLAIWQTIVFAVAILYFAAWTRRGTPAGDAQSA